MGQGPLSIKNPLRDRAVTRTLLAGFLLALGALVMFTWLAEDVREGDTIRFDEHVRTVVHAHSTPALTSAMRFFSPIGSPVSMMILSIATFLIFWRTGWLRGACLLVITLAGGVLLDEVLKLSFRRTRPESYFQYPQPHSFSFPSGHALLSFCFFAVVGSLVAARLGNPVLRALQWIAAAVIIALIGFSRIYLGVHYPTDVIGGYLAAFVWVMAVTHADRWHRKRRERE